MAHFRRNQQQQFLRYALQRYPYCQWCGCFIVRFKKRYKTKMRYATVDHIIPKQRGGKSQRWQNFILVCNVCNQRKGNKLTPQIPLGPRWFKPIRLPVLGDV